MSVQRVCLEGSRVVESALTQRLLAAPAAAHANDGVHSHTPPLQIASAGSGLDVAKVAEAQPGLLLLGGAVWEDQESLKEQLTVSIST